MSKDRFHLSSLALPLLCAVIVAVLPARSAAQSSGWRLVLAVDSTGQTLEGTKAALRDAVRAGQPIRVAWSVPWRHPDGRRGLLEHVADASFLTIHLDEVFAQITPILRQRPTIDSVTVQLDAAASWVGLLDTTGRLRGVFTGTTDAQNVRLGTRWYAPRPAS